MLKNSSAGLAKQKSEWFQVISQEHAGSLKRPPSKAAASEEMRRTLRYVESLSDARTPLTDFFNSLLEEAGLTTGEAQCVKCFVDLLGRVLRRHREAYTAGSVRNSRRPDCGRVDSMSE